jgi:hypothetical protein
MAVPKTFATAKALAALMGWAPLMGQALPRNDYLNPTDSWRKYRIYRAQVTAVTAAWLSGGCYTLGLFRYCVSANVPGRSTGG